jgi:hypothetical protein
MQINIHELRFNKTGIITRLLKNIIVLINRQA